MWTKLYNFGLFGYFCEGKSFSGIELGLLCAVSTILIIATSYALGSISTSIIISKMTFGDDVRRHGSGNAGATNMLRTYGKKSAVLTLLGDLLKTVIAVFIGRLIGFPLEFCAVDGAVLTPVSFGGYIAGLFAVIGHTYPVYHKFRGGKGVICAATVVAMLSPRVFFAIFIIFLIIVLGTKFVSLGSVICVMIYPILLDRIYGHSICTIIALTIVALVVYNHRENIKRLLDGKENKISVGKKDKKNTTDTTNETED